MGSWRLSMLRMSSPLRIFNFLTNQPLGNSETLSLVRWSLLLNFIWFLTDPNLPTFCCMHAFKGKEMDLTSTTILSISQMSICSTVECRETSRRTPPSPPPITKTCISSKFRDWLHSIYTASDKYECVIGLVATLVLQLCSYRFARHYARHYRLELF